MGYRCRRKCALRINRGLTASRYVAVVISPEMLSAPWPSLEWTHIVADDPTNRRGRIIPLFLRDYSEALKQQAELPAPFKALNWIDFRRPADFKSSFRKMIRKVCDEVPARAEKGTNSVTPHFDKTASLAVRRHVSVPRPCS